MGLIFDIHAADLYDSWLKSPQGKAMDRLAEEAILTLLEPQPGLRVLDVGCGEGNHLIFLNKLGLDISGIDASSFMIKRARERLGNRCSLTRGFAEDLPYDDNEFDLVVMVNTLEFLNDPLQALREAGRVSKSRVFIGVMNSLSWHCLSRKLKGLFHESFFDHIRFYNLWELKTYLQTALGQTPVEWHCSHLWPPFVGKVGGLVADKWNLRHCPFGSFLGIAATIVYKVRTDNLPLKLQIKKTGKTVAEGLTMENLNYKQRVHDSERSLSL